jgi:hypothetical protein
MHHILNTKSHINYSSNVFVSVLIDLRETCLALSSMKHSKWLQALLGRKLQDRSMILGLHREGAGNYALQGYYATSSGTFFPTLYDYSFFKQNAKQILGNIWCVSENLQLNGAACRWCQRTTKRVDTMRVDNTWYSIHSRMVHKCWSIYYGINP